MTPLEWYEQEVSRVRDEAHISMSRDPATRLFLYFCPGRLAASPASPSPVYALATPEALPSNRDRAGLRTWIRAATRRVPCLPDTRD